MKRKYETKITQARLKETLHYDPSTGELTWLKTTGRAVKGRPAGSFDKILKCVRIRIDGELHVGHRLAWLYMHGEWPEGVIVHANGDKLDNRLANLRQTTISVVGLNRKMNSNNTSGFAGVSFYKSTRKYVAHISIDGRNCNLGYYETPQEAHRVYLNAKNKVLDAKTKGLSMENVPKRFFNSD